MRAATLPVPLLALLAAFAASGQSTIVSSKHDLSVTGGGAIRAVTETQVCVFCHVGHSRSPLGENRPDVRADYLAYKSSTLTSAVPSSPTGATRICLSCHDGTIALGETVASGTITMLSTAPGGRLPADSPSNLGTDLRRTHPVSFVPAPSRTHRTPEGRDGVKLDRSGQVQCTSCHDPHSETNDPIRKQFLLTSNRFSAMCLDCHVAERWGSSSHRSSTALADPSRTSQRYAYSTVGENGCESCHRSHNASEHGRLVRGKGADAEQQICLDCHNGRVAKTDIAKDLGKAQAHTMPANTPRVHDAAEGPGSETHALPETRGGASRHVTCVDCHNPHAAFSQPANGPQVGGALAGVWGIDRAGERVEQVNFEYEVCFKCHADSANQPRSKGAAHQTSKRALENQNLRLVFAADALSAHAVIEPGRSVDSPSLVAPWTPVSVMTCTACHASDSGPGAGGAGAAGPHGSTYDFMLERNLSIADRTQESPVAYALCYECHDRKVVLSDASAFPLHRVHVVDASTPCTACHNPHGIAAMQGQPDEHAHLIDFDTSIVSPGPRGVTFYRSRGQRHGVCTTSCHGVTHNDTAY